jgi:hypothetical protein
MAVEAKQFIGAIDNDSPNEVIGKGYAKDVWNMIPRGTPPNVRYESVLGTTLVPNSYLPSGTNLTIYAFYDANEDRVFFFNYNSNGSNAIYIYYTITGIFATLIQDGINTQGQVLSFTPNRIHSAYIIYQDENNGDLLWFLDSLSRPTMININRYLAGTYNPIKRSFIEVIKGPPRMSPRVTYENDNTVTVNNLLNALFKFRVRWVYDDNNKSVYGTPSIIPLPNVSSLGETTNSDPTQNSRIAVYVPTGDVNVTKIEIWVQQFTDGVIGDWLLVTSIIKNQTAGLNNNDVFKFLFYNDAQYTSGIEREIIQLQDKVPLRAGDMTMLNGNSAIYGNITEGFNPVPVTMSLAAATGNQPPITTTNGVLFFAVQGGVDSYGTGDLITIYLTGTGTNDGSGNPTTIPIVGGANAFVVDCATSTGSSLKFSYSNLTNVTSIPVILSALQSAAVTNGFTAVSSTANSITLSYTGVILYYAQTFNSVGGEGLNQAYFAYPTKSAEQYALCYFDEYGRTAGAFVPTTGSITTVEDVSGLTVSRISATISSRPPSTAYYYSFIRPSALTYNERLFWVCNQTFTNVDPDDNNNYAYIGISNMVDYNNQINTVQPNTTGNKQVVSYDFVPGDRIRFLINYPLTGSPILLSTTYDYEITAVQYDPIISGVTQYGTFIKILYPASDVNANFDFGMNTFQNYKVLIYNYAKHPNSTQNTVYYEFGRMFAIGNPGTSNAYHIGSDQTQSADLSRPAIISTTEGDLFFRQRLVNAGEIYYVNVEETSFSNQWATLNTNNDQGLIDNSSYQISQQQAFSANPASGLYPNYSDNKQIFWNKLTNGVQIRLRTVGDGYTVTGDKALTHKLFVKVVNPSNGVVITYLVKTFAVAEANTVQSYQVEFDTYVTIPAGGKAWILAENDSSSGVSNLFISGFILRLDALNNIQISIIESSFSDKYNIVANSNSRPITYDPNAGQFTFGSLVRWGEQDLQDTNLNNSNRFFDENSDEYINNYGPIIRMVQWQKVLRIMQYRKCGEVGVYAQYLKTNTGEVQLVKSDTIITKNNIQYMDGDVGIGNQADGIGINGYDLYFPDPVKGSFHRWSLDGIKDISEEFMVKTFAGNLLPNYLRNYAYPGGGNSVVLGVYNFPKDRPSEMIFCFQGGTLSGNTLIDQSISFVEKSKAFSSKYNYAPDAVVCAENQLILFKNGELYIQNNNTLYANFFGTQQYPSITCVFNENVAIKKTYEKIAYQSNQIWRSNILNGAYTSGQNIDAIITSMLNPQTGFQQSSSLLEVDYEVNEGLNFAAFLYDVNSGLNGQVSLVDGDYLKGVWLQQQFTYKGSGFVYFYAPYVGYEDSPKNL